MRNPLPFRFLFFLSVLLPASVIAQGQTSWLPYFGNTHFGFSTGTLANGRTPSKIAMADLDADGDLDAVLSKGGINTGFSGSGTGFEVLLNQGNGYYGTPTHYPTGKPSNDVLTGDFNGDNKPDVIVTNTGSFPADTTISLFPGLGTGLFGTAQTFKVGSGPTGLAAADLNSDGFPDLAVANYNNGLGSSVSILYNNGTGGFSAPVTIATALAPYRLVVGRINSDNLPDLAVAHENQKFSVLFNSGTGFLADSTYQVLTTSFAGDSGPTVALADIDLDLDLDVLYSSSHTGDGTSGQIAVRKNTGNGTLDSLQFITLDQYSGGTSSLQVADLNGDGAPDLVASSPTGRTGDGYRVLLNQGSGTFGATVVRPGGQNTSLVAVGDVNQDSFPDVLTIDTYSLELTVHRNPGNGQFATPTLYTAGIAGMAGNLEVADLDLDGDLDIITSSDRRSAVPVPVVKMINNGAGVFAAGVTLAPAGVQAKCRDLNNDSLPDLLFIGGTGSTGYNFYTALNQGNGTFATPQLHTVGACAPEDIDAADFDNDGDLDVVATSGCTSAVYVCKNQGNATFAAAITYTLSFPAGPLALGDFNHDKRTDIVAGIHNGVVLLLADTLGSFTVSQPFTLDDNPFDLVVADLNDDGFPDIASCNYGSGPGDYNMSMRLGNGQGGFSPVQTFPAAYSPDLANVSGITTGDIDNDLDLDLMVSNNATNDMSVYLNQGNGVFGSGLRAGLYYGARSPWFADFNNDGHCEVAALVSLPPGGFQSALAVLEGTNSGSRTASSAFVTSGIKPDNKNASLRFSVAPNPFHEFTNLRFSLSTNSTVTLSVYNLLGQQVSQLLRENSLAAGEHVLQLNKESLRPGTYMVQLRAGDQISIQRILVE